MRPAVFLDRDDTLIMCNGLAPAPPPAAPGDLIDPALVALLPGVPEACAAMHAEGFALVVVSNQGCVARGAATLDVVNAVNTRLRELLTVDGEELLKAVYFCPYHPRGTVSAYTREHPWRKPGPGMILAAAEELGLDLKQSWLVGDAARDIEAGLAAGLDAERCLRVGEGGAFPDLLAAAAFIMGGTLDRTTVTLHAAGEGLMRDGVRGMVKAAAEALAERFGLSVRGLNVGAEGLIATLAADEVTAVGFAAELRRNTNQWYEGKYASGPLWRTPVGGGDA